MVTDQLYPRLKVSSITGEINLAAVRMLCSASYLELEDEEWSTRSTPSSSASSSSSSSSTLDTVPVPRTYTMEDNHLLGSAGFREYWIAHYWCKLQWGQTGDISEENPLGVKLSTRPPSSSSWASATPSSSSTKASHFLALSIFLRSSFLIASRIRLDMGSSLTGWYLSSSST